MAIMDFASTNLVPALRGAQPVTTSVDRSKLFAVSGGVSRVYKLKRGKEHYAYKCWISRVDDIERRYPMLRREMIESKLPYFLGVEYHDEGITVNSSRWPVLVTQWNEGATLGEYIAQHHQDQQRMSNLAERLAAMFSDLESAGIAHGDLHDGNVLVTEKDAELSLLLIDYDGMYVPQMGQVEDLRIAVASYQHPARATNKWLGPPVDYFSQLCIYLSVLAYAKNPALYKDEQDQQLLFTFEDFELAAFDDPESIYAELRRIPGDVQRLTEWVRWSLKQNTLEVLPPLSKLVFSHPNSDGWLPPDVMPAQPGPKRDRRSSDPGRSKAETPTDNGPLPPIKLTEMTLDDAITKITGVTTVSSPTNAPQTPKKDMEKPRAVVDEPVPVTTNVTTSLSSSSSSSSDMGCGCVVFLVIMLATAALIYVLINGWPF